MLLIAMGLGGALWLVFTRHSRYDLFQDALVIRYLAPRTKVVLLSDIQGAELERLPFAGLVLLIRQRDGGRLVITPTDVDSFRSRLNAARWG